jgi:hypothetical protein
MLRTIERHKDRVIARAITPSIRWRPAAAGIVAPSRGRPGTVPRAAAREHNAKPGAAEAAA